MKIRLPPLSMVAGFRPEVDGVEGSVSGSGWSTSGGSPTLLSDSAGGVVNGARKVGEAHGTGDQPLPDDRQLASRVATFDGVFEPIHERTRLLDDSLPLLSEKHLSDSTMYRMVASGHEIL
jgi:hypothetical protein